MKLWLRLVGTRCGWCTRIQRLQLPPLRVLGPRGLRRHRLPPRRGPGEGGARVRPPARILLPRPQLQGAKSIQSTTRLRCGSASWPEVRPGEVQRGRVQLLAEAAPVGQAIPASTSSGPRQHPPRRWARSRSPTTQRVDGAGREDKLLGGAAARSSPLRTPVGGDGRGHLRHLAGHGRPGRLQAAPAPGAEERQVVDKLVDPPLNALHHAQREASPPPRGCQLRRRAGPGPGPPAPSSTCPPRRWPSPATRWCWWAPHQLPLLRGPLADAVPGGRHHDGPRGGGAPRGRSCSWAPCWAAAAGAAGPAGVPHLRHHGAPGPHPKPPKALQGQELRVSTSASWPRPSGCSPPPRWSASPPSPPTSPR